VTRAHAPRQVVDVGQAEGAYVMGLGFFLQVIHASSACPRCVFSASSVCPPLCAFRQLSVPPLCVFRQLSVAARPQEETMYGLDGGLVSDGTWEYKPPLYNDIPIDFRVELLKDSPNPQGVKSAKVRKPPSWAKSWANFCLL
jgi:hypothetical protein